MSSSDNDGALSQAFAAQTPNNLPSEAAEIVGRILVSPDLGLIEVRGMLEALKRAESQIAAMASEYTRAQNEIERLKTLSETDGLTKLSNKAYMAAALDNLPVLEQRHTTGYCFLGFDLDGFKEINDKHGHLAGDQALVVFARMLQSVTRRTDVVARLGGDEFGVLLKGIDEDGAKLKVKEIEMLIKDLSFEWDGASIPIRGSVGMCRIDPDMTGAQILDMADQQMYANKRARAATRGGPAEQGHIPPGYCI